MPRKPKRVLVGYRKTRTTEPGTTGKSETSVAMTTERGATTRRYVPTKRETGAGSYGKVGEGKDVHMNELIDEAQSKGQRTTAIGTKPGRTLGKRYAAGTYEYDNEAPKINTTHKVKLPAPGKVKDTVTPIYKYIPRGKNKAMRRIVGTDDKRGPGSDEGIGRPGGLRRRRRMK